MIKLSLLSFTLAAQYLSLHKQNGIQLLEEDSQSIDARSRIECILKCRTQFNKKNGFYTEENFCFCFDEYLKTADNVKGIQGTANYEVNVI